jgi:SAM-dependent methyltransferase
MNIESSYQLALKREHTLTSYSEWNELYSVEKIILSKRVSSTDNIIEFGCGAGRIYNYLYNTLGCKNYLGLDISDEMLCIAKHKYPSGNFRYADIADIGLSVECHFSTVLFMHNGIDTIYPEERRVAVFRNAYLLLEKGGLFIYSTHLLKESLGAAICSGEHRYYEEDYYGTKIWMHRSTEYEVTAEAIANGFILISKHLQNRGSDSWLYLVVEKNDDSCSNR